MGNRSHFRTNDWRISCTGIHGNCSNTWVTVSYINQFILCYIYFFGSLQKNIQSYFPSTHYSEGIFCYFEVIYRWLIILQLTNYWNVFFRFPYLLPCLCISVFSFPVLISCVWLPVCAVNPQCSHCLYIFAANVRTKYSSHKDFFTKYSNIGWSK